ncbi:MAG: zinc metalloprotease HtpX, partial [Xanthomonadaceae bacterium]|nr:zinc metalloprotease HtpX [Xanthomonadaceae bacterium]
MLKRVGLFILTNIAVIAIVTVIFALLQALGI